MLLAACEGRNGPTGKIFGIDQIGEGCVAQRPLAGTCGIRAERCRVVFLLDKRREDLGGRLRQWPS